LVVVECAESFHRAEGEFADRFIGVAERGFGGGAVAEVTGEGDLAAT